MRLCESYISIRQLLFTVNLNISPVKKKKSLHTVYDNLYNSIIFSKAELNIVCRSEK